MNGHLECVSSKVIELLEPKKLVFRTEILPSRLNSTEVLVETIYSAISPGTEISAYVGLSHLRPRVTYPRLLGYCNVGRIMAKGQEVSGCSIGDLVLTHTCHRSHAIIDGDEILAIIPDDENAMVKTLAYLYVVAEAGVRRPTEEFNDACIIGLGLLGLMSMELLRINNIPVIGVSNHKSAVELAIKMGAAACYSRAELEGRLNEECPVSVDKVILNSNKWMDWQLALAVAECFGQIAVTGFPGRGEELPNFNVLDPQYFYHKQLTVAAVGHISGDAESKKIALKKRVNAVLESIDSNQLKPSRFMLGEVHWTEIDDAYADLCAENRKPGTFVLTWKK